MKKILKAAVATALFGAAGVASATDFYLCPPSAGGGCTDVFEQMTVFLDAQSNYTDTNMDGGISAGDLVTDDADGNVTGFQPFDFGDETQGYIGDWILNVGFTDLQQVVVAVDDGIGGDGIGQIGETVGVASQILGGSIDIFYQDGVTNTLVAQLTSLTGSATIGNIVVDGEVDFSNVAAGDVALAQDLFFFANGDSWYDLWSDADGDPVVISSRFDTNIDQLEVLDGADFPGGYDFVRQTNLDGSVRFDVPVPAPLALVGLGLMGLGFSRRQRRA
jgi:hypothetical protein